MLRKILYGVGAMLALTLGRVSQSAAQAYIVIVNDAVPVTSMAAPDVAKLFQKRVQQWPGGLVVDPVDQTEASAVRLQFSRQILGKSTDQVKAFWQTQIFSGRGFPPVEVESDRQVVLYVLSHAGAVGYVAADTPLPVGVRRLLVERQAP